MNPAGRVVFEATLLKQIDDRVAFETAFYPGECVYKNIRVTRVKNLKAIDELYFFIFLLIYYLLHEMYAGMYLARNELARSQINADC